MRENKERRLKMPKENTKEAWLQYYIGRLEGIVKSLEGDYAVQYKKGQMEVLLDLVKQKIGE